MHDFGQMLQPLCGHSASRLLRRFVLRALGQRKILKNAVDHFAVVGAQILYRTADALCHKAASLNGGIAVDNPLAQFRHALAGGPEQVADGFLVIGVHTHANCGAVFKQLQRAENQMLQNTPVLGLQNPACSGLHSRAGQFGQFIAPGLAERMPLGLKGLQHIAKHLPHVGPEFLKFGPGLRHARLKSIVMRMIANNFGFFTQITGFAVLGLGLGQFFLSLSLERKRLARELQYAGLGLNPGFFQHLLPLGIGRAKNLSRPFLGSGAHPGEVILLVLLLRTLAEQGLLHGIELLR